MKSSSSSPMKHNTNTSQRQDRHQSNKGSFRMVLVGMLIGIIASRSFQILVDTNSQSLAEVHRSSVNLDVPSIHEPLKKKIEELTVKIDKLTELHNHLEEAPRTIVVEPKRPPSGKNTEKNQPKVVSSKKNDDDDFVDEFDVEEVPRTAVVEPKNPKSVPRTTKLVEFTKQPGVVIATKVHGLFQWNALEQSQCLLNQAFNNRVGYDIVVFTSEQIPDHRIEAVRKIVAPASFKVVMDNPGLQEMVNAMTEAQRKSILERCNVTKVEQLNWQDTKCQEDGTTPERLGYNWQAEFRSKWIWNHEALKDYTTMLWIDSDAFCTIVWPRDPVTYMLENRLAILFDNFPMGRSSGEIFQQRIEKSFGKQICDVNLVDGHLWPTIGDNCKNGRIRQIHGFFHITNMTFYRENIHWAENLIGDERFQRKFDDQLAVTVPAAILLPNRSQDMRQNGIKLDVFHNGRLDGKDWVQNGFKVNYWPKNGTQRFPEAAEKCRIIDGG